LALPYPKTGQFVDEDGRGQGAGGEEYGEATDNDHQQIGEE
jgi:hypothetical protein